jgi:flagellar assembly protein FliH
MWSREEMSAAERLNSWSEFVPPPVNVAPFRARFAESKQNRGWNATHPGSGSFDSPAPEAPADPIELASRDAFVQGFKEGERVTREAAESDDRARLALADALKGIAITDEGTLATLLSQSVIRLLGQIVGSAPIDEDLLQERCAAVAACIDSDSGKATLEVNPQDMALIDAGTLGVTVTAKADLPRGSVRLATAEGWVEDGPDIRISRLKALLDGMEGRP